MVQVIYCALVLDPEVQDVLRTLAAPGHVVYADHVTLAFGEKVGNFHREALVGRRLTVWATGIVQTTELVCIELAPNVLGCVGRHPHVTISCVPGVRPVASNRVLEGAHGATRFDAALRGRVGLFVRDGDAAPYWRFSPV